MTFLHTTGTVVLIRSGEYYAHSLVGTRYEICQELLSAADPLDTEQSWL